jgi:thiol-disulfide isomerase/thioredoxin
MDNTLKIVAGVFIAILVACVVFFLGGIPQHSTESPSAAADISVQGNVTVYFFYGEECPHCHNVMPFIQNLSKKYPDVDFRILETWHNETNNAFSKSLNQKLAIQNSGVPEVIVVGNNTPLIGDRDIPAYLEGVILEQLKKKQ